MKADKLYSGTVPKIHEPRESDISTLRHSGLRFGKSGQLLKSTWTMRVYKREKPTRYAPKGWAYDVGQLTTVIIPMNCILASGEGLTTQAEASKLCYEARDAIHDMAVEKLKRLNK